MSIRQLNIQKSKVPAQGLGDTYLRVWSLKSDDIIKGVKYRKKKKLSLAWAPHLSESLGDKEHKLLVRNRVKKRN